MSNVELPPLTHEKITQFDVFLGMVIKGADSQIQLHDPFFSDSSELSDHERRAMARDVRAQARILYHSPMNYISHVVVGGLFGSIALMGLFLWLPATIYMIVERTYPKDYHLLLLYAVVLWSFVIYLVRRHLRIKGTLETLALRFPGSVGSDRNLQFLAWLDAHWPAHAPLDEIKSTQGFFPGGRWDLQASYRDCPLLVRICDLFSIQNSTPWRRVSIYLSAPQNGVTSNEPPANIKAEFDKLGYHAYRSPAGMYMCHNGRSLEALNPERIARLLDLAYRTIYERNGQ